MAQDQPQDAPIKTMKLYTHIDRIQTELSARNLTASIDPLELSQIDSMHYLGNAAIESAVIVMKLNKDSTVLDVGSGFGGPARVLTALSKCRVMALELQSDIHELAKELTMKCNLSELVEHVCGDILDDNLVKQLGYEKFDGIVSYLVFLHIPNKTPLFNACAKVLKPGGTMFIEDFYCIAPFTEDESASLAKDVFCKDLPSKEEYVKRLESSGFENIQFVDMTAEWTQFVTERLNKFKANKEQFTTVHGEEAYSGLLEFYTAVAKLFSGGNLGGVRVIAKKK